MSLSEIPGARGQEDQGAVQPSPGAAPGPGQGPAKADAADRLGTVAVSRLLLQFSVPAITGMLVNALYNVVDRIFVGRGVNEIALGGLSLVLPLMTIHMAIAMLFGIGSANMISIRLGQGRRGEAENALNHCFFLLLFMGILITVLGIIFMEPLLSLLGAQKDSAAIAYSREYFRIILLGSSFSMVGFGFSHCTRAQGFPTVTMVSMILGAGLNMILDPVFIFLFGWGVSGAAWATIISQFASTLWIVSFSLGKRTVIKLKPRSFSPSLPMIGQIMAFGSAQFLLQFIMSAIQLLTNMSMGWYGAAALGVENGGDIALSGMSIAGSIIMMIFMPVFGINQGAQPILGYNYGAKRFDRVLRAYILAAGAATAICLAGFAIVELFPQFLVGIFLTESSETLLAFAPRAMRINVLLLPLTGFQIVSTNMYVVTGRPKIAIFLSLLRQFIVLIPCMLIFGRAWGLWGVVAAGPVADAFAFAITTILISGELRKLRRDIKNSLQTP